jgi:Flp pilus assembly protein TadD
MLAALAAGADGVYMGSALMATVECPIHERIKENMVAAKPDHPDLIRELIAPPRPEDFAEIMAARDNMPLEKWLPALEKVMLKHHDWQEAKPMWEQDLADVTSLGKRPKGPFSFACAYTNSVVTVKEFIDNMVGEAEEIMERLAKQWELGGGGGQDGEHKPAHRYGNEGIAVQDPTVNEVTQSKPVSSEDAVAAEKLNIEGNDLGRSGNFSQAEIKYTAAIALDSKYQEPWYNRGKARLNLRKYKAAISDFDRALTLSSDPKVIADIFNNRGIAKKKLGDVEGAILDYGKALKQNPALYRVYVNRGIAYYELGKKAQAIGDFRIARDHGEERAAEALRQLGAK